MYDKDYPIKGQILDLGVFFITIETDEEEIITIPSNVFIQKMVVKK